MDRKYHRRDLSPVGLFSSQSFSEVVHARCEPCFGTAEKNLPRLHRETTTPDRDPFRRIDPRRNSRVGNHAGSSPAASPVTARELAREISKSVRGEKIGVN